MAWSKFDPTAPIGERDDPQAKRRAALLKWGNWISLAMLVLGFGLIVYWTTR